TTTIVASSASSTLSVSPAQLSFGLDGSVATAAQPVLVSTGASVPWTASTSAAYLTLMPSAGVGTGDFQVGVVASAIPAGASVTATVLVSAAGISNSPQAVTVKISRTTAPRPFGSFDTPLNNTTAAGAIAVTGWALDAVGIENVRTDTSGNLVAHSGLQIWRSPITGELQNGLIYLGDAVFVAGARPDVEVAYPTVPDSARAGWGYLLLTNELPSGGNGTFVLHAIATNVAGASLELGTKTIVCNNAQSKLPFGTIDTPAQGGTIAGTGYANYGWALTPRPGVIPVDGDTLTVFVDGQPLPGHPVYNNYRSDIATLFPSYANSGGAVGYYVLDTRQFADGIHSMAWLAVDSNGQQQGLGSRFFYVQNGSAAPAIPESPPVAPTQTRTVEVDELGWLELRLPHVTRGRMVVQGQGRALPPGSTLDTKKGVFYWQLAPGFLGEYDLEFDALRVRVVVHPGRNLKRPPFRSPGVK
ncbi:MAG: hypothetical protein ACRD9L_16795, partial [Bryobacteraceae bacterium]